MNDAVAPLHHALDRFHVGNVGLIDLLAVARRGDRHQVREAQDWIDAAQCLAQAAADAPTRAGDQHPMHFHARHSFLRDRGSILKGTGERRAVRRQLRPEDSAAWDFVAQTRRQKQ
jgi:hypothetical protein